MAESAALEGLITDLKYQRLIVDYFFVAPAAVLIYDYLLTIHREIAFVWFSPWTYMKILFFLVRYLPIICIYFELQNQLLPGVSMHTCQWSVPFLVWVFTMAIFGADVVLTIRTWAVWKRDRRIGLVLGFMLLGTLVATCLCNALFLKTLTIGPVPYPKFKGCSITGTGSRVMMGNWISGTVLNINVLALMIISAYRAYQNGDKNRFTNVVHRDGVLSYIYLLGVTIANLICTTAMSAHFQMMLIPLMTVFYSVLTSRIVITLRDLNQQDVGGQHVWHGETSLPLTFRSGNPTPK